MNDTTRKTLTLGAVALGVAAALTMPAHAARTQPLGESPYAMQADKSMASADADKNGKLSKAEAQKGKPELIDSWSEFDIDSDGTIDTTELYLFEVHRHFAAQDSAAPGTTGSGGGESSTTTAAPAPLEESPYAEQADKGMATNDADKSGNLSKDEAATGKPELIERWVEFDVDKDGSIDTAELYLFEAHQHFEKQALANAAGTGSSTASANTKSAPGASSADVLAESVIGTDVRNAAGDTIGNVDDLIVDGNGHVAQAILSVGGFLGIDDKLVAVPYDELKITRDGDDYRLAYDSTEDKLEAMTAFEYKAGSGATTEWQATDLIGQDVINAAGDQVGQIDDLVVSDMDTVPQAVISVGGFFGIDAKHVAVPYDQLKLQREKEEDKVMFETTKEQLESMPSFVPPAKG